MRLFDYSERDVPSEAREDDREERERQDNLNHWCTACLGHTGPGSECFREDAPPRKPRPVISAKTAAMVEAVMAKVRANKEKTNG